MARKKKDPMMDPTSIGNIVMTAFGVTGMQLSRAIQFKNDNPDMMLGEALIKLEILTRSDLELAMERQAVLRADSKSVVDIAIARTKRLSSSIEGLTAVQERALLKLGGK